MILAAIDLDALIPLIVGVFWVVAQIAGAVKKKSAPPFKANPQDGSGKPRPAPETAEGEAPEDPFADLMRKLGGVQEFKVPVPPEPVGRPAEPARPEGLAPPIKPEVIGRAMPPAEPNLSEPVDVPGVDIRPTMKSFKTAMPSMKLPAMRFQGLGKSSRGFPKAGKIIDPSDQQTLRRAILGHIILGKPKAMEGWSTGTVE